MMDTRCVKILRRDERVCKVVLSYGAKTWKNMVKTAEKKGAGVKKTSFNVSFLQPILIYLCFLLLLLLRKLERCFAVFFI